MTPINDVDRIYLTTAEQILEFGTAKSDRTGTGTISLFGQQMVFDLTADKLPLLTTKELKLRSIIHELIWFLRGEGNIAYLKENNVGIWNEWADENGDLGPVYGVQWRRWEDIRIVKTHEVKAYAERGYHLLGRMADGIDCVVRREIDQIADLLHQLRTNPDSRRLILTAWNPSVVEEQALPPCHSFVQFYTRELSQKERSDIVRERVLSLIACGGRKLTDGELKLFSGGHLGNKEDLIPEELLDLAIPAKRGLSCHLYQRSGDYFLGVPFNIASYSLLTHMIAHCVGMEPLEFIHTIGDAHLYSNHLEQIKKQLDREGVECSPYVVLSGDYSDPGQFTFDDIKVVDYEFDPAIPAPISV